MSKLQDKLTYEELLSENELLKNKCNELIVKNKILQEKLTTLHENQGCEICEFFNKCKSLQKTAEFFSYDDIVDCGNALVYFYGCSDPIQSAKDYKEYCILAYGKENDEEQNSTD